MINLLIISILSQPSGVCKAWCRRPPALLFGTNSLLFNSKAVAHCPGTISACSVPVKPLSVTDNAYVLAVAAQKATLLPMKKPAGSNASGLFTTPKIVNLSLTLSDTCQNSDASVGVISSARC
jgi:hypothetical protein